MSQLQNYFRDEFGGFSSDFDVLDGFRRSSAAQKAGQGVQNRRKDPKSAEIILELARTSCRIFFFKTLSSIVNQLRE